ncbi:uncharacterized protein [Malus domestica]|uniref:uncharacterized protein n=1 Tax=Malus domestica TaxID=3750 RepID=UPI003975794F
MGKSTADLPSQSIGQSVPQAQNPLSAATPESTSATHREREVNLGGQLRGLEIPNRNTCVLNEGIIEECDEDGGEGSDPPTRSFLRKRLDEQSWSVEQTFSRGIDKLHDAILNANDRQTKLLEMLVSKVGGSRPFELLQHCPPGNNPVPIVPVEPIPAQLKPINLEKGGGSNSRSDGTDHRIEATPVDMTEVQRMIDSAMKKWPKFPKFIHPYPAYVETFGYPKGFKIPDFSLFAGESSLSSLEHVARFTAQCGDVNSDFHKLRLFNFSLTGSAFAWYINLPPNSVQNWEELVEKFHEQFYRPGMEMSVSSLARMAQASDESPMDYLTRFKSARNWCRVPLPEVEFVRLALNGLDVEYKKKFLGANFRDMYELAQHVEQYDYLLREEKISKTPTRGTIYKNPTVNYASTEDECFPEKKMSVDTDPFPTATVNMVDAYLPKDKGKGKAEVVETQRPRSQNCRPRFMANFRSNKPPTALTGPAIVKPMMDYSTDKDSGAAVLCGKCKAKVNSEPEEKPSSQLVATTRPKKRRHQRIDCMARRRAAQETSAPKWRPKDTAATDDERPPPAIMTELAQGKRLVDQDVETMFEEADKRIKLLIRPGEMKARLEHFRQEAESKLYPPAIPEPLKTSDPGLKARFQHIREARVLGFEIDPYTDINAADLPFSLEDLQYLRYHFEVFSAVSLFSLTTDEIARIARLDAYLDTRDARLHYQEQVQVLIPSTLSISPEAVTQNQPVAEAAPPVDVVEEWTEESRCLTLTTTESVVADQPNEEGLDQMGPSVLDNMESAALAELFPRSSSAKLHHLKPLYVTAHIEGYPVSKVFVNCGATVNIMPLNIMKALRRSNDELIQSGITMSSFVGNKSQTKGVLPLTVNIAGRTHMTVFFVVDSKTEYNALLGRDWIYQTSCIPSSLYQVLVLWDGKSVTVHPADSQPFEVNMIQARYYDDHVGYITLQGFNEDGRPTRISVQKAIEVGAETVHQDSARLGLANFLPESDV